MWAEAVDPQMARTAPKLLIKEGIWAVEMFAEKERKKPWVSQEEDECDGIATRRGLPNTQERDRKETRKNKHQALGREVEARMDSMWE